MNPFGLKLFQIRLAANEIKDNGKDENQHHGPEHLLASEADARKQMHKIKGVGKHEKNFLPGNDKFQITGQTDRKNAETVSIDGQRPPFPNTPEIRQHKKQRYLRPKINTEPPRDPHTQARLQVRLLNAIQLGFHSLQAIAKLCLRQLTCMPPTRTTWIHRQHASSGSLARTPSLKSQMNPWRMLQHLIASFQIHRDGDYKNDHQHPEGFLRSDVHTQEKMNEIKYVRQFHHESRQLLPVETKKLKIEKCAQPLWKTNESPDIKDERQLTTKIDAKPTNHADNKRRLTIYMPPRLASTVI